MKSFHGNYLLSNSKMNFSTYKMNLLRSIDVALSKDRRGIVNDFSLILGNAKKLLRTNELDFWIQQLETIGLEELPITHVGLKEAKRHFRLAKKIDRKGLGSLIGHVCEVLFTYSPEDDLCEMQSQFHYYFHIPSQSIFKESEMGQCSPEIKISCKSEIRITTVSELNFHKNELIQ